MKFSSNQLYLIIFYSRKIIFIKTKNKTYNNKILTIIKAFKYNIIIKKIANIRYFF